MKVLHVLHELKFSGAEIMYVDAAQLFQDLGCDLSVVATAENLGEFAPYFENSGYTVYHIPFPYNTGIIAKVRYCLNFIHFIRENRFDLIHIHAAGMRWWISFSAWMSNAKSVYTFHNVFTSTLFSYPWHLFQRWSAKTIFGCKFQTISKSVHDNEQKRYFNKTIWINNWYGSNRFYPANKLEKQKVRESLGINDSTMVLISVGGCSHVKRHSHIIQALPKIKEQNHDVLYLHLGKGSDEKQELELSRSLKLQDNVRFEGNTWDLRKYIIASDIYLMPSKYEGMPITTMEVMGCQIPCILYNVPGLKDFNSDGQNCILVEEDYNMLSKEIIKLFSNLEEMVNLGVCGKNFVDRNFSLQVNAKKIYDSFYIS